MMDLAEIGDQLSRTIERDAHEGYLYAQIEALEQRVQELQSDPRLALSAGELHSTAMLLDAYRMSFPSPTRLAAIEALVPKISAAALAHDERNLIPGA